VRHLRPGLVAAALVLSVAAPAWAHDGQDTRPGAARVDLEVLVTPPVNGETSPGGHEPSIAVDRFGNLVAAALKELPVAPDGRATPRARLAAWRWTSGDDGQSFQDMARSPAMFDVLLPEALSTAAAADDAGHSFVLEGYGGQVLLTSATATTQDDVVTDATTPLPIPLAGVQRLRADAVGDATTTGRLHVLATSASSPGTPTVWTGTVGTLPGRETPLPGAAECTLAADHRRGSRTVYAGCVSGIGEAVLWTSRDAGATFTPRVLRGGLPDGAPSVSVGPDGTPWLLVTTTHGRLGVHHVVGNRVTYQDLTTERGTWKGGVLDVSRTGRLGLAAYHRAPGSTGWHVRLAVTSPGKGPLWVDFASHDPVSTDSAPPDSAPAVAFGPDARLHLLWSSTKVTVPGSTAPLLRNVWSVRTLST
jgi:hypothetical protein